VLLLNSYTAFASLLIAVIIVVGADPDQIDEFAAVKVYAPFANMAAEFATSDGVFAKIAAEFKRAEGVFAVINAALACANAPLA